MWSQNLHFTSNTLRNLKRTRQQAQSENFEDKQSILQTLIIMTTEDKIIYYFLYSGGTLKYTKTIFCFILTFS